MKKTFLFFCCVLLIVALFDVPYGFYQVLRLFVCGTSIWIIVDFYKTFKKLAWIPCVVAVVYNPLFRVFFDKPTWTIINVITLSYFIYLLLKGD